ncbi:LytTR family DNA-binding domain-containing protein [Bacillus wiedmannii]|uniref:LytTR family DNA-binding domain-containing protein n=1 Tax=Bacillus wiedmannii TaxID=1890302 RepID=UPI000BF19426|nr:LytTR family DNA-binding domain-containing protein [Bacillus wiedmannii]PEJ40581.1 LytTR family transcriptional regulator [Bacillus wiedmannii]
MKVRIELDPSQKEVEIIINTGEVTDEIQQLLKIIEGGTVNQIVGVLDHQYYLLNLYDIYWFYTEGRKVMAQTKKGSLEVKARLYELEEQLAGKRFARFSKSILANLGHVKSFEMSFSGSMCAHFSNRMKEYISRKYVPLIKESLHIGGG